MAVACEEVIPTLAVLSAIAASFVATLPKVVCVAESKATSMVPVTVIGEPVESIPVPPDTEIDVTVPAEFESVSSHAESSASQTQNVSVVPTMAYHPLWPVG